MVHMLSCTKNKTETNTRVVIHFHLVHVQSGMLVAAQQDRLLHL